MGNALRKFKSERFEDVVLVMVEGELDGRIEKDLATRFGRCLDEAVADGNSLVLDLDGVTVITSVILRQIHAASRRLGKAGGRLVVTSLTSVAREIFDITGFSDVISLAENPQTAIAGLSPSALAAYKGT